MLLMGNRQLVTYKRAERPPPPCLGFCAGFPVGFSRRASLRMPRRACGCQNRAMIPETPVLFCMGQEGKFPCTELHITASSRTLLGSTRRISTCLVRFFHPLLKFAEWYEGYVTI